MELPFTKGPHLRPRKIRTAVEFRRHLTTSERAVWTALRGDRTGFHFRRQHVIDGFIVDFFCVEAKLVVELDGEVHDTTVEEDARRTRVLEARGVSVIRFRNEDVDWNIDRIIDSIRRTCTERVRAL